jgi:tetratricopeptide (TPR) repeat protein
MNLVHSLPKWTLSPLTFGLGFLIAALSLGPALADNDGTFQCGVRLFNSARYASALKYFDAAQKETPYDARIPYYEGLCQHKLGHIAAARGFYQQVVDKFPDSDAAELAKQGLGTVDFGSGYDRPGGTLAKLDKLRMDIVPPEVTLNCQEKDGKPVVEVSVDGKKISFVVDPQATNTFIGTDLVRANSLNETPIIAKHAKATKNSKDAKSDPKSVKPTKDGKDAKEILDQKTVSDNQAGSDGKDGKAANLKDGKDSKAASESKAANDTKTGTDEKQAKAAPDTKETKNTLDTKESKDAGAVKDSHEISAEASKDTKAAKDEVDEKAPVNAVSDANVVLYDLILGPVERPGFPVFVTPAKPKQAVLGRDFLGPYKVTFNATAKTLNLVRDRAYSNPFAGGMDLFNKGKFNQAVPLLKRATENRPGDPRPLYCYAAALQRSGSMEAAKLAYRQVNQRFPNSEANFYAVAALNAIDPSYMKEMKLQKKDAQGKVMGNAQKNSPTFDVPYTKELNYIKVIARIDGLPVEMLVDFNRADLLFSSQQLSAVNPAYLDELQEVGRTTDDSNMMMTTVTKTGYLKRFALGNAEKFRVPITVIDTGPLKYLQSWGGTSLRPLVSVTMFNDWKWEVMDDLKVIRFTRK